MAQSHDNDKKIDISQEIMRGYEMTDFLHQGGQYAYFWCKGESKRTIWYPVSKPASLPKTSNEHVYFGVHPADRMGSKYQRTKIEPPSNEIVPLVCAVNCLFAEFDKKDFGNDMTATLAAIHQIEAQPSVLTNSGGGYHGYWYLDSTFFIDGASARQYIRDTQAQWVVWTDGDKAAKDLARMLRFPGTVNIKPKYGPNFPVVHYVKYEPSITYKLDDLEKVSRQKFVVAAPDFAFTPSNEPETRYITTHTPHYWLDMYIEYSQKHSPRAFSCLHEFCGLWLLSSVVAGRIVTHFGGRLRQTALMIAVIARSSVWSKSHTIGIAERVLKDAGMDWRELPNKATPQAIIEDMADNRRVIEILNTLNITPDDEKELIKKLEYELNMLREQLGARWANEGQRAWHISEFGSKIIAGMMRAGSPLSDFSDLLRDINEKVGKPYTYRTRGHGEEKINNPYLAVIADTTPADLRQFAKPNAPLWSNGFFPRFAIIAPLSSEQPNRARVPYEIQHESTTPIQITKPLADLHQYLGHRKDYQAPLPRIQMTYSREVYNMFYEYEEFIQNNRLLHEDLDGTYARLFAEQCVSIAMLLAIMDNSTEILTHHAQRAIEICERIRQCTDDFYLRMTDGTPDEKKLERARDEDRALRIIERFYKKKGVWPTMTQIKERTGPHKRRWPSDYTSQILLALQTEGVIEEFKYEDKLKRGKRFKIII